MMSMSPPLSMGPLSLSWSDVTLLLQFFSRCKKKNSGVEPGNITGVAFGLSLSFIATA